MESPFRMPDYVNTTQLIVRNFPADYSKSEKKSLLNLLGSTKTKTLGRNSMEASFQSETAAWNALRYLHQKSLHGKLLYAEFGRHFQSMEENNYMNNYTDESEEKLEQKLHDFVQKINAVNAELKFEQPPPPHLKYLYPKVNREIVDAICIALISSTPFYIQVLHLMNRLNLEPPFVPGSGNLSFPTEKSTKAIQTDTNRNSESPILQSDESELDEPFVVPEEPSPSDQMRRKRRQELIVNPSVTAPKRLRSIINANKAIAVTDRPNTSNFTINDVFDRNEKIPTKIEIVPPTTLQSNNENLEYSERTESTQEIESIPCVSDKLDERNDDNLIEPLSNADLNSNKIPMHQLTLHPLFQNYDPGIPSNKLYIKNVAKTVTENDLRRIYYRYAGSNIKNIDIRLMVTGRMKGQAFITFNHPYLDETNFEIVKLALNETNGYILKDKALIVVFGKSS